MQTVYGMRLSILRHKYHLSTEEMAKRIGVTSEIVQEYESGLASPTVEVLDHICRAFRISADEFLALPRSEVALLNDDDWRLLKMYYNAPEDIQGCVRALLEKYDNPDDCA